MPNRRKPGQTFLGLQVDEKMLAEIDSARGFKDRSQFVREAIAEKLATLGVKVAESLIYPPPRAKFQPVKYKKGNSKKSTEERGGGN